MVVDADAAECVFKMLGCLERTVFIVWSEDLRLIYANQLGLAWSGLTLTEAVGKKHEELFPAFEDSRAMLRDVLATEQGRQEWRRFDLEDYQGKIGHWVSEILFIRMDDGRKAVAAISRDITKKVELEREVSAAKAEALKVEQKAAAHRDELEALLQTIPASVIVVRRANVDASDFTYEFANRTSEDWAQRRIEPGMLVSEVFPEVRESIIDLVRPVVQKGVAASYRGVELTLHTDQGPKTLFINTVVIPLSTDDGVDRALCFSVDVTKEMVTTRELENVKKELQRAVRARDEYMSVASHELRTPLSSAMLQTDLLIRNPSVPANVKQGLERIQQQGKRIGDMVATLLDAGRLSQGDTPMVLEPTNARDVVTEVVSRLKLDAEQAGCEVSSHLEDAVGNWDRARLDQVVTNLLTNTFKYGSGHPVIVCVVNHGSRVEISVQDFGMGIPEGELEGIFEQFHRLDKNSKKGLGLGLWISKRIVEQLGGTIRVESVLGEGSTFTVELPLISH